MKIIKFILRLLLLITCVFYQYNNPIFNIHSFTWLLSFVLFLIIILLDFKQGNFYPFLLSLVCFILYNPITAFFTPDYIFDEMTYGVIILISIGLLLDLFILFFLKRKLSEDEVLKFIKLNKHTGNYEVLDGAYRYEINNEMIEAFKEYMNSSSFKIIAHWYQHLDEEQRKKVRRTSRRYQIDEKSD